MKSLLFLILLLVGCSSSLQAKLNTAYAYEQATQPIVTNVIAIANRDIALLAPEQQAAAKGELDAIAAKVTAAYAAKDAALLDAINTSKSVDVVTMIDNITILVTDLISVAAKFSVDAPALAKQQTQLYSIHAKVAR